jgi:truncated hemoglobin YjbI
MNLIYSLYDIIGVEKVYLKKNIRRLVPHFYDKINKKGVGNSPPA